MPNGFCSPHVSGLLPWLECHSGFAAWLQGIGSIIALIAIGTPIFLDHLNTRRSRKRHLEVLFTIAEAALQLMRAAIGSSDSSHEEDVELDQLNVKKWDLLDRSTASVALSVTTEPGDLVLALQLADVISEAKRDIEIAKIAIDSTESRADQATIRKELKFNERELVVVINDINRVLKERESFIPNFRTGI